MLDKLSVKFVGTGGVFDYKIGNSSVLVECEIGTILIDCGYTVYPKLVETDIISKIDYILITHLHGDHIGSIHPLILHLVNRCKKNVKIIYPTEHFLGELKKYLNAFLVDSNKYVEFVDINNIKQIGFVDTTNCHVNGLESYAYYFESEKVFAYFSGDLGDIQITEKFLEKVRHNNVIVFHETSFVQGKAHVYYKELMDFSSRSRYSVYAYHCNHLNAPEDCDLKFVVNYKEFCL